MRARSGALAAAIAAALLASAPARADVVYPDDVIVQGNGACIGFDCTVADVFAFVAVRLKENNLRFHFDDTSDPLDGPATDWRIAVNDSASSGPSFFRIEDATVPTFPFRVDAGAATDALVVGASGGVGLGTGAPAARLHTVGSVRVSGDLLVLAAAPPSGVVAASALVKRVGTVTFAAPAAGPYAIALTPIGSSPKAKLEVYLTSRTANGFTFAVRGNLKNLSGVAWTTRPVGG